MTAWRVSGNLKVMIADAKVKFPGIVCGTIGDVKHMAKSSDHNVDSRGVVCAVDFMVGVGPKANAIVKALIGRKDVAYVIHNRTIWSASYGWKARRYTGEDPHTNHVHASTYHTSAADNTRTHLAWDKAPDNRPKPAAKPPVKVDLHGWPWPTDKSKHFAIHPEKNPPKYKTVELWLDQMAKRGWKVRKNGTLDSYNGRLLRQFQAEKGLTVDGKLGMTSYLAAWTAKITK